MKQKSMLYAGIFFLLYITQSLFCGLLVGTFGVNQLPAQAGSALAVLIICGIILRKKEMRVYYGICFFPFQKRYLPLFILILLNVPYLFIGENGNIWSAFAGSIFVGIMEELIFRGFLFRGIEEKYNTQKAVIASGLLFGLFHLLNIGSLPIYYLVLQIIYASAIGILFAVVFSITHSLLLCMGIHFLVDLIAFIGGDNYNITIEVFATIVCVAVAACYVVMWKKIGDSLK